MNQSLTRPRSWCMECPSFQVGGPASDHPSRFISGASQFFPSDSSVPTLLRFQVEKVRLSIDGAYRPATPRNAAKLIATHSVHPPEVWGEYEPRRSLGLCRRRG